MLVIRLMTREAFMFWNKKEDDGSVELRERRWEYFTDDFYIWRKYRRPNGTTSTLCGRIRWYNRWFIKLMNRNKPRDTRTVQQIMNDGGIIQASIPGSNVVHVNTELIQKMKHEGRWKE